MGRAVLKNVAGKYLFGRDEDLTGFGTVQVTSRLDVVNDGFAIMSLVSFSDTAHPIWDFLRARGTEASPTALLSGDAIGQLDFAGYSGTLYENSISITAVAKENFSSTNSGAALRFAVTRIGDANPSQRFQIGEDGDHVKVIGENDAEMVTYDRTADANVSTLFHTGVRGVTAGSEEYYEIRTGALGASTIRFAIEDDGHVHVTTGGSDARPAILRSNDVDTGVTWPAADVMALVTGGTERLRVRADGIVVVRRAGSSFTYTPNARVAAVLMGDSSLGTVLNLTAVATTGARQTEIWFGDADTEVQGRVRYENDNNIMELWTNNSARVWVHSGGALGILDGITAPSSVSGQAQIYVDAADGDLKVIFGDGTVKTIVVDT